MYWAMDRRMLPRGAKLSRQSECAVESYKQWCDQQGIPYDMQRKWGEALTERRL